MQTDTGKTPILLQKSIIYEGVHQWSGSHMAFRRTDAVSSELLSDKRVNYGDYN